MFKKIWIVTIIIFALFLLGAAGLAGYVYWDLSTALASQEKEVVFRVSEGENIDIVTKNLNEKNLLRDTLLFPLYLKFTGKDKQIKTGIYSLSPSMNISQIAEALASGKTKEVWFTIPEGWTAKQIAEELAQKEIVTKDDFLNEVNSGKFDYAFLADKPEDKNLEGYLFPDTYKVEVGSTAHQVIEKMLDNFQNKLNANMLATIKNNGLTVFQTVILASIIEKEARADADRRLVSGVFKNRLTLDMPLESCATLQYILGTTNSFLTYEETQMDNPYNTYKNMGLPPGPISNPGLESLRAAVYPKETDYLYFLSDKDGNLYFSETYWEHLAKREQYLGE